MTEVELTWGRTVKIWWSLVWRYLLLALLFGSLFGFIAGVVRLFDRFDKATSASLFVIMATLMSLTVSLWVVNKVLQKKKFGDFRIVLMSDNSGVDRVPPTQSDSGFDIR